MVDRELGLLSHLDVSYQAQRQGLDFAEKLEVRGFKDGATDEWYETHPHFNSSEMRASIDEGRADRLAALAVFMLQNPRRVMMIVETRYQITFLSVK